jgi:membrane-anchored protein YejM (alkaline phosphatase superfamily)
MSAPPLGGGADRRSPAGQRFPAIVWALLHVPIFLALYAQGMKAAVAGTPEGYRLALWPTFVPQAALLALIAFLLALPLSWSRAYRFAAPGAAAFVTGALALDANIFQSVGFHLNGFFFRVLLQPNALREAGVPLSDVLRFLGGVALFAALDVWLGARFIRRFASQRRAWTVALAIALLSTAERVYGATLVFFGGPAIFAASTVLPLQVPVRMNTIAARVFGKKRPDDPFSGAGASKRLPAGITPAEIRIERRPDVLFLVAESLPALHLDASTMPRLLARAGEGALFTDHYAGASSTNYTLFSLMYGLQAQKLEAIVGAGRQPVLFPALSAHGYRTKMLAASCVDWMDLKETVFAGAGELRTWCEGSDATRRDEEMLADARAFAASADPQQPVFMFLFFFGTHFNYFYDPQDRVHVPDWDGGGSLKATTMDPALVENRARNAAHKLDRIVDGFLTDFERTRGKAPLVVFTGDHGEEFRQKGHIAHGSAVTREQIHVPAIWLGPGVPKGRFTAPTSHADVVPTLLSLLGDRHPPSLYADGMSMFEARDDRFVVATVGWEPEYAVIGKDLKFTVYAGLGGGALTDPDDKPLPPGGEARMAASTGRMLKALRGETAEPAPAPKPAAPP